MKKVFSLAALSVIATPCFALIGTPQPKHETLGFNKRQLVFESKEGKALREGLEKKKQALEEDLMKKEQELRATGERFQKQAAMLSPEALRKKQREIEREIREIGRMRDTRAEELNIEAKEELAELGEKLKPYAVQARKDKGASYLLDLSASNVEDFDPSVDITHDVIKLADAAFDTTKKSSVEKSTVAKSA